MISPVTHHLPHTQTTKYILMRQCQKPVVKNTIYLSLLANHKVEKLNF